MLCINALSHGGPVESSAYEKWRMVAGQVSDRSMVVERISQLRWAGHRTRRAPNACIGIELRRWPEQF